MQSASLRNAVVFAAWLAVMLGLAMQHAMWRDEVRALSLAVQGSNVVDMLHQMRGDGHPALWYLLLRAGHALIGAAALPVVAALIGIGAAMLLAFTSGIRWWVLALVLSGAFLLYEYSVMARNYGLSMLILFALAGVVRRNPASLWTGVLLFLLANVNIHSVLLAAAFLLFLLIETLRLHGLLSFEFRRWLVCAGLAGAGVAVCVATIYPPMNDAAVSPMRLPSLAHLSTIVLAPAGRFYALFPPITPAVPMPLWHAVQSLLLFASTLGLLRSIGAWIAAVTALIALSMLFDIIYPGSYRHEALWLVFLVTMYWVAQDRRFQAAYPPRLRAVVERVRPWGIAAALIVFALQIPASLTIIGDKLAGLPESRIADLGRFLDGHPEYRQSWIVADPDALLETLPYYAPNPTYLIREQRAGRYSIYTSHARLDLRLGEVLDAAAALRRRSGRPVLILLTLPLDRTTNMVIHEAYDWTLSVNPGEAQRFLAAAHRRGRFRPARTDEAFDLYSLD